jgi:hypothetical protein
LLQLVHACSVPQAYDIGLRSNAIAAVIEITPLATRP